MSGWSNYLQLILKCQQHSSGCPAAMHLRLRLQCRQMQIARPEADLSVGNHCVFNETTAAAGSFGLCDPASKEMHHYLERLEEQQKLVLELITGKKQALIEHIQSKDHTRSAKQVTLEHKSPTHCSCFAHGP